LAHSVARPLLAAAAVRPPAGSRGTPSPPTPDCPPPPTPLSSRPTHATCRFTRQRLTRAFLPPPTPPHPNPPAFPCFLLSAAIPNCSTMPRIPCPPPATPLFSAPRPLRFPIEGTRARARRPARRSHGGEAVARKRRLFFSRSHFVLVCAATGRAGQKEGARHELRRGRERAARAAVPRALCARRCLLARSNPRNREQREEAPLFAAGPRVPLIPKIPLAFASPGPAPPPPPESLPLPRSDGHRPYTLVRLFASASQPPLFLRRTTTFKKRRARVRRSRPRPRLYHPIFRDSSPLCFHPPATPPCITTGNIPAGPSASYFPCVCVFFSRLSRRRVSSPPPAPPCAPIPRIPPKNPAASISGPFFLFSLAEFALVITGSCRTNALLCAPGSARVRGGRRQTRRGRRAWRLRRGRRAPSFPGCSAAGSCCSAPLLAGRPSRPHDPFSFVRLPFAWPFRSLSLLPVAPTQGARSIADARPSLDVPPPLSPSAKSPAPGTPPRVFRSLPQRGPSSIVSGPATSPPRRTSRCPAGSRSAPAAGRRRPSRRRRRRRSRSVLPGFPAPWPPPSRLFAASSSAAPDHRSALPPREDARATHARRPGPSARVPGRPPRRGRAGFASREERGGGGGLGR
jgi:hypothetical protein